MSMDNPDFEALFHGAELATPEDLQVLENLALDLVNEAPATIEREACWYVEATQAELLIGTIDYQDNDAPQTSVSIGVCRGNTKLLEMAYTGKNDLRVFSYSDTDDLAEAGHVCGEIIRDSNFDTETKAFARFLQRLITAALDEDTSAFESEPIGATAIPAADLARKLVIDHSPDVSLAIREWGTPVSFAQYMRIIRQTPVDAGTHVPLAEDDERMEDFEAPLLIVALEDYREDLTYCYEVYADGVRLLDVSKPDEFLNDDPDDEAFDEQLEYLPELQESIKNLRNPKPRKQEVDKMIEAFMDATFRETTPANPMYPDMIHGFIDMDFVDPNVQDVTSQAICREVLHQLQLITEFAPMELPAQPNYIPNQNQLSRAQKYLSETVRSKQGQARRVDIVNLDEATLKVVDHLFETENHPVAQALAVLYNEYQVAYGGPVIRRAATEVIINTHWKLLRSELNQQVATWRQAHDGTTQPNRATSRVK